jgi:Peptidase inhibitor I78 family
MMMIMAACTASASGGEEPPVPERGTGRTCDASKAQALVGRIADEALGAEAMRLTGAGALRWVPMGAMVTMDYRPDRLNIHLGLKNEVTRIACG